MMTNLMTILERKAFISSNPRIVLSSWPPPGGHFSIQESATGGLSYKVKKQTNLYLYKLACSLFFFPKREFQLLQVLLQQYQLHIRYPVKFCRHNPDFLISKLLIQPSCSGISCVRACLKKAFCKMCVTICGRFCPDEGVVAGYDNRIRAKYTAK